MTDMPFHLLSTCNNIHTTSPQTPKCSILTTMLVFRKLFFVACTCCLLMNIIYLILRNQQQLEYIAFRSISWCLGYVILWCNFLPFWKPENEQSHKHGGRASYSVKRLIFCKVSDKVLVFSGAAAGQCLGSEIRGHASRWQELEVSFTTAHCY